MTTTNHRYVQDASDAMMLFGVEADGSVHPLTVGDAGCDWSWFSYGPEARVVPCEGDDSGATHEWELLKPLTSPAELDAAGAPVAVTVYEYTHRYGGPEEGGWGYAAMHPIAVLLIDQFPGHADAAVAVARLQAKQLIEEWCEDRMYDGAPEDRDFTARTESVIGSLTTVGSRYYC